MSRRPTTGTGSFRRHTVVRSWLIDHGFKIVGRVHNRLGYRYDVEDENGTRAYTRYGRQFTFKMLKKG